MSDGTTLYTTGELARRTGLTVKTIRFYSDAGVVPPTDRTSAGYRLYDVDALARLELVRTLRDLGVDLATIQRVLEREVDVTDVAAAHAEALDVQIRTLRLRRAVLRAVAKRGSTPKEMELMHKLARLSEDERQRIIDDFRDEVFGGLDINPDFDRGMRSVRVELPDDPTPEQVDAWVELAELVRDESFRRRIREMAEHHAAERAAGTLQGDSQAWHELGQAVTDKAGAALAAGVDPGSPQARPILDEILSGFAEAQGRPDDQAFRAWLMETIVAGGDARAERYWQLLAVINGWPQVPSTLPAWEWLRADA